MREDYYPRKDPVVSPLKSDATITNLHSRQASIYQAPTRLKPQGPAWESQLGVLVALSLILTNCASNAHLVNETATGRTALYSYVEEQDVLTSPGQRDALRLLEEQCPAGYRIAPEGEAPRIDQAVDRAWNGQLSRDGQVSREKRWAIQFICK